MRRRTFLQATAGTAGVGLLAPAAAGAAVQSDGQVLTGFDTLARDGYQLVAGQRVGLVPNSRLLRPRYPSSAC